MRDLTIEIRRRRHRRRPRLFCTFVQRLFPASFGPGGGSGGGNGGGGGEGGRGGRVGVGT